MSADMPFSTPTARQAVHAQFVIERVYPFTPAQVFAAWSQPEAKNRWFVEGEGWEITEYSHDFRVGGREQGRFAQKAGDPVYTSETVHLDIVPGHRIVLAHSMARDGEMISGSLLTVELHGSGNGTRLRLTEQGAYLDGLDTPATRQEGWSELLEALGRELGRTAN